jgi:isoleucyl-tRNA synthetase
MPALKRALTTAPGAALLTQLRSTGRVELDVAGEIVTLDADDIEVRLQANEGWTAAQGSHVVVVLATELSPALVREGFAQDLKRQIQDRRRSLGCQYTDRIRVGVPTDSDELWTAIEENQAYLLQETLATHLVRETLPGVTPVACELADTHVQLYVEIDGKSGRG